MLHAACESAYCEQYGRPINLGAVPSHTTSLNDWVFQAVQDPNGTHTRLVRVNGIPEPLIRNMEKGVNVEEVRYAQPDIPWEGTSDLR